MLSLVLRKNIGLSLGESKGLTKALSEIGEQVQNVLSQNDHIFSVEKETVKGNELVDEVSNFFLTQGRTLLIFYGCDEVPELTIGNVISVEFDVNETKLIEICNQILLLAIALRIHLDISRNELTGDKYDNYQYSVFQEKNRCRIKKIIRSIYGSMYRTRNN